MPLKTTNSHSTVSCSTLTHFPAAAVPRRELRTHPRLTVQRSLHRMVQSVRDRPAPWVVGSGLLILVALIGYRKGHE